MTVPNDGAASTGSCAHASGSAARALSRGKRTAARMWAKALGPETARRTAVTLAVLFALPVPATGQDVPDRDHCGSLREIAAWLSDLAPAPAGTPASLTRIADLITDPNLGPGSVMGPLYGSRAARNSAWAAVREYWTAEEARALAEETEADAWEAWAADARAAEVAARARYGPRWEGLSPFVKRNAISARRDSVYFEAVQAARSVRREAVDAALWAEFEAAAAARTAAWWMAYDAAVWAGALAIERTNEIRRGEEPNVTDATSGFVSGAASAAAVVATWMSHSSGSRPSSYLADRLAQPSFASGFADGVAAVAESWREELRRCERRNP